MPGVHPGDRGQQQPGGHPALLVDRLGDRGQPVQLGHLVVVDADHRDVPRHGQPELTGSREHPEGQLVGRRDDTGRPVGASQQLTPDLQPAARRPVPHHHRGRVDGQPVPGHGLPKALGSVGRCREVHRRYRVAADVADPGVPQRDQVLGGHRGGGQVVDPHARPVRVRHADRDHRDLHPAQQLALGLVQPQREHEHRVHPLEQHPRVQQQRAVRPLVTDVEQQHVEAVLAQHLGRTADQVREVPPRHVRDDDPDHVRLARGQAGRRGRGHVLQVGRGADHLGARLVTDLGQATQGARDGRGRDTSSLGDVLDPAHWLSRPHSLDRLTPSGHRPAGRGRRTAAGRGRR